MTEPPEEKTCRTGTGNRSHTIYNILLVGLFVEFAALEIILINFLRRHDTPVMLLLGNMVARNSTRSVNGRALS
jgi:hypothetical protein